MTVVILAPQCSFDFIIIFKLSGCNIARIGISRYLYDFQTQPRTVIGLSSVHSSVAWVQSLTTGMRQLLKRTHKYQPNRCTLPLRESHSCLNLTVPTVQLRAYIYRPSNQLNNECYVTTGLNQHKCMHSI